MRDRVEATPAPAFATKVADVVGLHLELLVGAVVLSIDAKTQIQALGRTQPMLPITFDATTKRTCAYVRHGTTSLFAAPENPARARCPASAHRLAVTRTSSPAQGGGSVSSPRHSIRRGLVKRIRLHRILGHLRRPFTWTATVDETFAKVQLVQTSVTILFGSLGIRKEYR